MYILEDKIVTTRKKHQCFLCMKYFNPRTKMHFQTIVDDGEFSSTYTCIPCKEFMSKYCFNGCANRDGIVEWGCIHDCNHNIAEKNKHI